MIRHQKVLGTILCNLNLFDLKHMYNIYIYILHLLSSEERFNSTTFFFSIIFFGYKLVGVNAQILTISLMVNKGIQIVL